MNARANLSEIEAHEASVAQLRIPPSSPESESALLGGLLMNNNGFDLVADLLTDADFYRFENRLVYGAIGRLINATKPADVVTVFEELKGLGREADGIGLEYLNAMAQFAPSSGSMRRYAELIKERSLSRQLLAAADAIGTTAYEQLRPAAERIEEATQHLTKLLAGAPRDEWQDARDGMVQFLDGVQARSDKDAPQDFVPTGLTAIDEKIDGGVRPGEVIIIGARPSMGKTALALTICLNAARAGHASGLISMEMSRQEVQNRQVAMVSRIPLHKIKRPERLSDFDWSQMVAAVETIRVLPMYVTDQAGLNINQIRAKARALKRRHGLRLLTVDYLGLMDGTDRKANRTTQLEEATRGLKNLAKELGISVLLLAQLNREVEKRPDQMPIMSDLRDCGAIEQDADVILFLHRPAHAKPDLGPEWKYYAKCAVAKQRNGPTGLLDLQYIGENTLFIDWDGERPQTVRSKGGDL